MFLQLFVELWEFLVWWGWKEWSRLFTQMVLWCRCESAPAVLWEHAACFSWYWCLFLLNWRTFFSSTAVAFVCSGWHVWLFMLGGEGSSPASKHVTALYFVFHSEGHVLWQIFWMLINFLFALWTGEGGGERQTDKRSKKESERGCIPRTKLLLFLYSMKTHCIMKIFYMDSRARSSNTVAKTFSMQQHILCWFLYPTMQCTFHDLLFQCDKWIRSIIGLNLRSFLLTHFGIQIFRLYYLILKDIKLYNYMLNLLFLHTGNTFISS